MKKVINDLTQKQQEKLKKKTMPAFTRPMLAKLTHSPFFHQGWLYERKLDGERCLVFKKADQVILKSRNNKKINSSYPEIEEAAGKIPAENVILDGEIVTFQKGVTSFSRLQPRMHVKTRKSAQETGIPIYYYIFDIIYLDQYDLSELPLVSRKKILRQLISFRDPLRYTPHRINQAEEFFKQACRKKWEGLIAKDKQGSYIHARSSKWQKFKCTHQQELVIAGYTEPQGERIEFGALLVGYYDQEKLRYAGKVGTGFSEESLRELGKKFKKIETDKNPFSEEIKEKKVHFIKPEYVGEIGFTEWTKDLKLRHPRFLGLRRDKPADKVHKEG